VEPEKQPLLANGSETTFVSKQRLGKHVPAATDTHATIEELLETVFYTRSVQRGYKEDNWGNRVSSVREVVRKKGSLKGAAVQRGLERVKLKNLHF
jgi:stage III sporulation protein SpoIIIAA